MKALLFESNQTVIRMTHMSNFGYKQNHVSTHTSKTRKYYRFYYVKLNTL
jgi:hypothetical protein